MSFKNPRNAWESDPIFGSMLLIVLGVIMPLPLVVLSMPFGKTFGPWIWILMCVWFWAWEVWMAFKPWHRR